MKRWIWYRIFQYFLYEIMHVIISSIYWIKSIFRHIFNDIHSSRAEKLSVWAGIFGHLQFKWRPFFTTNIRDRWSNINRNYWKRWMELKYSNIPTRWCCTTLWLVCSTILGCYIFREVGTKEKWYWIIFMINLNNFII